MPRLTISRALSWLAAEHPERLAVRDDHRSLSRRELDVASNMLARAYSALGVSQDDLVTVTLPNSVEFVVACVAIWKLGATPQPLSRRLPLEERRAVVELADSALVVGADADEFPGRATVPIGFAAENDGSELPNAAAASWKAPTSSGSTGHPKIVLAAAGATVDPQGSVAAFIPREAVQLVVGPLTHSAPFTYAMRGLMTGHSLVVLPRFDERRVLEAIDEHGITWMMLVPTMMHRILGLPREVLDAADLASLESFVHLGAPCDPQLKRAWIDWIGPDRVVEVYAGTESSGLTMITGAEWLEHPGSVGRPIGGSRMRIVDDSGAALPAGTVGRIEMTREGGATYRYLGRDEPSAHAPSAQPQPEQPQPAQPQPTQWHTLGDRGRLDADGYLWVIDREDDLIITGSVNVYPVEVERALERHPLVRSAVAFGVPDEELGSRIQAIVDVAAAALTPEDLVLWLRSRLDGEKLPRDIEIVHEPVRDDAGKVRRGLLAEERAAVSAATRAAAP